MLTSSSSRVAACQPSVSGRVPVRISATRPARSALVVKASVLPTETESTRVPWFKKPCPGFTDVASIEEMNSAMSKDGKMAVVDFYAGWCSSCKGAFPTLCKIPSLGDYSKHYNFLKVNIESEDPNVKAFIKEKQVRGIPYLMIFDTDGTFVLGMGASFKKVDQIKEGLKLIYETKTKGGAMNFTTDPNGFVILRQ